MRKHHPKNERIKRQYLIYLEEAKRMAPSSVNQHLAHIAAYESSTNYKDFAGFRIEQARSFKRHLSEATNKRTGKPLSKATINSTLKSLRVFFIWLAGQPGYRSKLNYSDADYFNDTNNDARIAAAVIEKPAPTMDQIHHAIQCMPTASEIDMRNRAIMAFSLLSGARDDAIASLSIKHIDLQRRIVIQDAREVRTKFRKTAETWFFPVGEDIEQIVVDWINYLTTEKLFGPNDPLFPATEIAHGSSKLFEAVGLSRRHWKTADGIRKIFRDAWKQADLPHFIPHSIRSTLALYGLAFCTNYEELKSWSENLMHEKMLTTLSSYAKVPHHRKAEVFEEMRARLSAFSKSNPDEPGQVEIDRVLAYLRKRAS